MAINFQPANPNVKYEGKTLPADKSQQYTGDAPADPDVMYAGSDLPREAVRPTPPVVDLTNYPSLVVLGSIASVVSPFNGVVVNTPPITGATLPSGAVILPSDVRIEHDLEKVVTGEGILDGVWVTEHVRRKPINVYMEFTIRARNGQEWIFGQQFLDDLMQKIVYPDTVLFVQNTLLNKIGVTQLVLIKESGKTIRGSINQPIILHFWENIPGESLIIN